jgi:transcriptional regulator with XRE-family HTH domain
VSELGKRVRAARCYAGLKQRELGARLEHPDDQNIKRTERGQRDPKLPERKLIADICGVPYEFFYADWDRLAEITPPEDRLAATEADVDRTFPRPPRDSAPPHEADEREPPKTGEA